ncbi:MAG: hypothetical protein A6F70_10330 [Cycloclasticus sp. symbiont of Bathymodiolus heckerae]|nr:MAG: hypothetical protein A6F70_10330 [Cycloclasticus sp. symbiont of Bathymodiolus heckerae]
MNELPTISDCYGDSICDADIGPVDDLSTQYWTASTIVDIPNGNRSFPYIIKQQLAQASAVI